MGYISFKSTILLKEVKKIRLKNTIRSKEY